MDHVLHRSELCLLVCSKGLKVPQVLLTAVRPVVPVPFDLDVTPVGPALLHVTSPDSCSRQPTWAGQEVAFFPSHVLLNMLLPLSFSVFRVIS